MRRVFFSTIGLLAFTATAALAADLPRAPVYKEAAYVAPVFSWTGPYVGINGGYSWGRSNWDGFASGTANTNGGLVGLTLGYNWQTGRAVFGLEGDIDWTNIRGSFTNAACPLGCETRNSWLGTVRGRLGYSFDRVLPYVTGGLAVGDIRANPAGFAGVTDTKAGWTVGGGIEAALTNNWTAKAEYLYVDLGTIGCSAAACGATTNVAFRTHLLRAGLNYKF